MTTFHHWGAGALLALHGLIHLMGFVASLRLGTVAALPYKTAVLGGRLELGAAGTAVFGLAWGVAALGLVLAAAAFGLDWDWWRPALLAVTELSLLLTVLDFEPAKAGIALNLIILALLVRPPTVQEQLLWNMAQVSWFWPVRAAQALAGYPYTTGQLVTLVAPFAMLTLTGLASTLAWFRHLPAHAGAT